MEESAYTNGNESVMEHEIISVNKFLLLNILSFNLYTVWWTYKAWRLIRHKDQSDIEPAMRAIFSIFFLYTLAVQIQEWAHFFDYKKKFSSALFFTMVVLLIPISYLPEPFTYITFLSPLLYIPAVEALNFAVWHDAGFDHFKNDEFNQRQKNLMLVGGSFWLIVIWGLVST